MNLIKSIKQVFNFNVMDIYTLTEKYFYNENKFFSIKNSF